ncbi:MAG TPA: tetratricopeptide repeat protein [Rhodothermales bacterium]|nr:tetratricopeptide repeat protein [Rhodothermales bacterium]
MSSECPKPFTSGLSAALLLIGLIVGSQPAVAQDVDARFDEGIAAFRDGNYADAERLFAKVVGDDPANAQARYMLARIYYETPMKDFGKAGKELDEAIKLEPDNIDYLVARLEHLRAESSNYLVDRMRDMRRMSLASQVLKLDPDNGVAHEELGKAHVRDFWRYRNAISLPTLGLRETLVRRDVPRFNPVTVGSDPGSDPALATQERQQDIDDILFAPDQYEFRNEDLFNIKRLEVQGVPVQDLRGRADRAYAKAIHHLTKALEADPMRRDVYDYLMRVYALKEDYPRAMSTLQDMYAFFPEDASFWFYLGLVHYRTGQSDAASKSFETALKYSGDKIRFAFENLDLFLPPEEKAAYQQDPIVYASRFWTSKDPRFLTPYNERKLEHYARLVYADLLYGAPRIDLRGWETQRGQILVRYGVPVSDVVVSGGFEAILRHVSASRTRAKELEQVDAPGQAVLDFDQTILEANTFNIWDYGDFKFVFEDPFRNNEYRLYSPSAKMLNDGNDAWENDYVIKSAETFRETPERYEYEAPGRQVDIPYLVTTFRGGGDQTDVLIHYGIPVQGYDPAKETVDLTVNTGTFLINDTRDVLVERRETLYGLQTHQITSFSEVSLWVDTNTLNAPPGRHEVSVEFETVGGGTVAVQRREIDVPNYQGGDTKLSDLLLAYAVEDTESGEALNSGDVVRNRLSITPAPWSVFGSEQPIHLYFELYDLGLNSAGRSDYEVEATLRPKEASGGIAGLFGIGGSKDGVSVRFDGGGSSSDDHQSLILDATDQPRGLYHLVVKIKDRVSGKTVQKEQDLFLE